MYVNWQYQMKRTKKTISFQSETMSPAEALFLYEDLEANARTQSLEIIDEDGFKIMKKELKKYLDSIVDEPHDIIAYFDGGFDTSQNIGSAGIVIYYKKGTKKYRLRENEIIPYIDSNNEAEYAAFWSMISALEELGVNSIPVTFKGDSLVVLKQLEGEWSCHDETLSKWLDRIEDKIKVLKIRPNYQPINRNENKEADKLATQALNDIKVKSVIEIID
ncbi:reverse transcriptase-like protein [Lottiidibacillus patelloidae]|uniref:reverse transcriptase-like protein n=1 Tax=Lottiidibacillus patelloidae TaxID=2670334 RepID=UPI001E470FB5|nr:reverse transcriptase-like protein [Lottiidibacillus patelloidae]